MQLKREGATVSFWNLGRGQRRVGKHLSEIESGQRGQREQSKEGPGKSVEAILVSIIGSFSYSSLSLSSMHQNLRVGTKILSFLLGRVVVVVAYMFFYQ